MRPKIADNIFNQGIQIHDVIDDIKSVAYDLVTSPCTGDLGRHVHPCHCFRCHGTGWGAWDFMRSWTFGRLGKKQIHVAKRPFACYMIIDQSNLHVYTYLYIYNYLYIVDICTKRYTSIHQSINLFYIIRNKDIRIFLYLTFARSGVVAPRGGVALHDFGKSGISNVLNRLYKW